MRFALVAAAGLAATVVSTPSFSNMDTMIIANELGSILAAEDFCGLTFDVKAVEAYIEKAVPADDISFPSSLSIQTQGSKYMQQEYSGAQKAAHCAQVSRVARSFGFIK